MPEEQAAGNATADTTVQETEQPPTPTWDQYKALQRKLQKAQTIRGEAVSQAVAQIEERLGGRIDSLYKFLEGKFGEDAPTLAEVRKTGEARKQQSESYTRHMNEIANALAESDFDWESSAELEPARLAWQEGRMAEASFLVKQIVSGKSMGTQDIEKIVKDAVTKTMREMGRTDTGSTTSVSSKTLTREALQRMSPAERLANVDKIKEALAKGELR